MGIRDEKNFILSRFLDGEEISESELNAIMEDPEALNQWESYSKIRAGLRGEIPNNVNLDGFADRVIAAIDAEPFDLSRTISRATEQDIKQSTKKETVINKSKDYENLQDNVADENKVIDIRAERAKLLNKTVNYITHIALVASVAAISVLGVNLYNGKTNPFVEESYIGGGSSLSISPVKMVNSDKVNDTQISFNNNSNINSNANNVNTNTANVANADVGVDKNYLRVVEERRAKELKTLDALLNDHLYVQRGWVVSNSQQ